jgi:hypothetical protein
MANKRQKRSRDVTLPVGVAEQAAKLLRRAAAGESLTTRLRSKLSHAAAEMEVCIRLARDGQIDVPKRLVIMALQGMAYLVHFRHQIREVANSLIGINNQ